MTTAPKPTSRSKSYIHFLIAAFVVIFLLIATLHRITTVQASPQIQSTLSPTPQATPTFDLQRLEKPVVASDNTNQVKKGAIVYWGVCMACHGDRGQGLTEEWKDAFGKEDRNCWNAGCHGDDHPPHVFLMPKDKLIPALAGMGRLTPFQNTQ